MRAGALASICVRAGGSWLAGVRCTRGCSCYEDVRTKSSGHFEGDLRGKRGGRERVRWATELGFKVTGDS